MRVERSSRNRRSYTKPQLPAETNVIPVLGAGSVQGMQLGGDGDGSPSDKLSAVLADSSPRLDGGPSFKHTQADMKVDAEKKKARQKVQAFDAKVAAYPAWRKRIFLIAEHKYFNGFFFVVIIVNAIILAFQQPLLPKDKGNNRIVNNSEFGFTVLFTIDVLTHLVAEGFCHYIASAWNVIDVVVVGAGWLTLVPGFDTSLGMLRMVRVLRPLRTLNRIPSMRLVVAALIKSVPGLLNVLAFVLFFIFIFAVFAMKMWVGVFKSRCCPANVNSTDWWLPPFGVFQDFHSGQYLVLAA